MRLSMAKLPITLTVLFGLGIPAAYAAERTVVLKVDMPCVSCPYIIRQSLLGVRGVGAVTTSYQEKTAVVTFDDTQTTVFALLKATADNGYKSSLLRSGGS